MLSSSMQKTIANITSMNIVGTFGPSKKLCLMMESKLHPPKLLGQGKGKARQILIFFFFNFKIFLWEDSFQFFFHCSQHVPIKFPRFSLCSPRVFPIAPCFNPLCFAQSPPLLIYIHGPKGKALHLSIETSILRSLHSFNFFCNGPIKLAQCKIFKKKGFVRHP